jgi:hypothetical protein
LTEFKDTATPQRDRIELHADRTYRLLEENRRRNGTKRQASSDAGVDGKKSRTSQDNEIISIL